MKKSLRTPHLSGVAHYLEEGLVSSLKDFKVSQTPPTLEVDQRLARITHKGTWLKQKAVR